MKPERDPPQCAPRGLSTAAPLLPQSEAELRLFAAAFGCLACGRREGALVWRPDAHVGLMIVREATKTCGCGFATVLYAAVNDILRERAPETVPASEALADAVARGLAGDPRWDNDMARLKAVLHREDWAAALRLGEAMVVAYQRDPRAWYNLGWLYGERGRWREAAAMYQRTCALEPGFVDAWHNLALMCARLGRHRDARLALEAGRRCQPDADREGIGEADVLARREGRHGEIAVVQDLETRRLTIGGLSQGGVFLDPPARAFLAEAAPGPGALPESGYTANWLLAGLKHPRGRALMLGLGAGAGAVMLLAQFPELIVEAVDDDPAVIDLATRFFPLVAAFRRQGRLIVRQADAAEFVGSAAGRYAFVLVDLYRGETRMDRRLSEPAFLRALLQRTDAVWVNLIGLLQGGYIRETLNRFAEAGAPLQFLCGTLSPPSWGRLTSNWTGAAVPFDVAEARGFKPFQALKPSSGHALAAVRDNLRATLEWRLTADEVEILRRDGVLPERAR